jgi:hypothetical protein
VKPFLTLVGTAGLALSQADVQQVNCPKVLTPGTIVVAQSVGGLNANYPVIILACYQLNLSNFSITPAAGGGLPTINVIGSAASGATGPIGALQITDGAGNFTNLPIPGLTEEYLFFSNITVANATSMAHGLLPILPGDPTLYLNGQGAWTVPAGTGGGGTGGTVGNSIVAGNGFGGFSNVVMGSNMAYNPNTNVLSSSGGGGGSAPYISIGNTVIGAETTIDFEVGQGILLDGSDIVGNKIQLQFAIDSTVVAQTTTFQGGSPYYCASSSASGTAYTCATNPATAPFVIGETINWVPDVSSSSGSITIAVNFAATPAPLYQPDGATNPGASYFLAGQMYRLWYNGSAWVRSN